VKRTKQIIGILLIVFAVAALVYWEADGRSRVTTVKVLAANENIAQGEAITEQMLGVVNTMPETVIEGAFSPNEISREIGKEAAQDIAKNQQISGLLLCEPQEHTGSKLSPFLIKSEWIDSRSSSLRQGDVIAIYNRDGSYFLGDFEVLFVKDVADNEIIESGMVDHFEILTDVGEYQKIVQFIDSASEKLLIVQRGNE